MKKQIISVSMLVVGFLAGATALSTLAAGTWTPPATGCSPTAAGCNTDAPINVGTIEQSRIGLLGLRDLVVKGLTVTTEEGTSTTNNTVGTTGIGGKVLTALDANGTVGWRSVGDIGGTGDACKLVASTTLVDGRLFSTKVGTRKSFTLPSTCTNGVCTFLLAIYDSSGDVTRLRSTAFTQLNETARYPKNLKVTYWWIKPGNTNDTTGTSCDSGRNGSTLGCDMILKYNDNSLDNNVYLTDDNNSSFGGDDNSNSKVVLVDYNDNYSSELYVCK